MVKFQKPNPKTLSKEANKLKKSNSFKSKQTGGKAPFPSSNVAAKKEKISMIKKTIKEQSEALVKPVKKEEKIKNAPNEKRTPKGEPVVNKTNKKNTKKPQRQDTAAPEKKVEAKQLVKKDQKAAVPQKSKQQKVSKQQNRKAPVVPEKAPRNAKTDDKAVIKPSKKIKGKQKKQAPVEGEKSSEPSIHTVEGEKSSESSTALMTAEPFDLNKFNAIVTLENIKKVCQALKSMVEKQVDEKKTSIFEDYRYFLNVCSFKIANCPKRMVKLNLAHSLVDPNEDDVVIIVPDLQRGAKVDYEPTIQHYEDLFREHGITGLKIVPFNQLRKECTTFEAKRKFANTYDYFLCDGRIVGHVAGFCGNHFQKPRSNFHAVRLNKTKTYKHDVEHALKRTSYRQIEKGNLISIPVGNHRFTIDQLADNIKMVVDQLKFHYPGGLDNIRNMHVRIDIKGTSSLPIYANLGAPPAETPNVIGMREKRMLKLKKEANEILSQFNMSKSGEFIKLDKTQAERKRKIQEARKELLIEGLPDDLTNDDKKEVPPKKAKKSKKEEIKVEENTQKVSQKEEKAEDDNEDEAEDDDEDDEEEGDEDDDKEEEDDDAEEDDDTEEDDEEGEGESDDEE